MRCEAVLVLNMADEDWAAEVDEQERQISGQVKPFCALKWTFPKPNTCDVVHV